MKKFLFLILCFINTALLSNVKIFTNNSKKHLAVILCDDNDQKTSINLPPGVSDTIFFKTKLIKKITLRYHGNSSRPFSAFTDQSFSAKKYPINDKIKFIINQNKSISMQPAMTSYDKVIQQIGAAYAEGKSLPSIGIIIHESQSTTSFQKNQSVEYFIQKEG